MYLYGSHFYKLWRGLKLIMGKKLGFCVDENVSNEEEPKKRLSR
jgi:hypothetical protein